MGMDDGIKYNGKIGERVNELRLIFDEDIVDLSRVVGVTPGQTRKLLKDEHGWSDDKIHYVAEHYEVTEEFLRYGYISDGVRDLNERSHRVRATEEMMELCDYMTSDMKLLETHARKQMSHYFIRKLLDSIIGEDDKD